MNTVKVGVIGLGFIGTVHLERLLMIPQVSITAIVDIIENKIKDAVKRFPSIINAKQFINYEEMLDNADIDAVFIATPTPTHYEIAMKSLNKGKHVFVEKPLTLSLEEAERLAETAKKYEESESRITMVGHVLKYWPEYITTKGIVKSGKIGEPVIARAFRLNYMRPGSWYTDDKKSGGVIVDMSLHDIYFLIDLLGEVESVYTQGTIKKTENSFYIDYAQLHINFKTGAMAFVEGSWAMPEGYPFGYGLEISGTEGMLQFNSYNYNSFEVATSMGRYTFTPWKYDPYYLEDFEFINSILNNKKSPIPLSETLTPLKVALKAREAIIEGGKEVKL